MRLQLPAAVNMIIDVLQAHGYEGFAVGGCVRDSVLNRTPDDWDITTSATPYQVKELFPKTVDTGLQHGTVTVMVHGVGYEVTTYRIDGEYEDGRHPKEVQFTSNLTEDLKRRDFTINAMAYSKDRPEMWRSVYDLGITRIIMPEFDAIMETPQNTPHHMYNVGEHTLKALSLTEKDRILRLTMLLHDIGKASMRTTDANGVDHFKGHGPAGKEIAKKILRRLKFDNDTIAQVTHLIYWHDYRPAPEEKAVRRAIHKVGEDLFPLFLKVQRADNLAQSMYLREEKLARIDGVEKLYHEIMEKHQCVSLKTLAVTGRDLIAEGMKPGPQMGAVLQELLEVVLDQPEMNEKEKLLAWWKEHGTCQKAEGTL